MRPNDFDPETDYFVTADGTTIGYMRGDFRKPAAQIMISTGDGEWHSSGRQVASYGHSSDLAARDLFEDMAADPGSIEAT